MRGIFVCFHTFFSRVTIKHIKLASLHRRQQTETRLLEFCAHMPDMIFHIRFPPSPCFAIPHSGWSKSAAEIAQLIKSTSGKLRYLFYVVVDTDANHLNKCLGSDRVDIYITVLRCAQKGCLFLSSTDVLLCPNHRLPKPVCS